MKNDFGTHLNSDKFWAVVSYFLVINKDQTIPDVVSNEKGQLAIFYRKKDAMEFKRLYCDSKVAKKFTKIESIYLRNK